MLHDDDALYFGVFARDDEPSAIIVSDLRKDFNTAASDGFLVVIDTFSDQRNGFEFATNPAGAKWDAQMSNQGREINANWDGVWDVRTRIVEDGWYAEIRIPFRTLKFTDQARQTWGLNFERDSAGTMKRASGRRCRGCFRSRGCRWLARSTVCGSCARAGTCA